MCSISIKNAKENSFQIVDDVNVGFNPVTIVSENGKNAVGNLKN